MAKVKKLNIEITAAAKEDWHIIIWASFPKSDWAKIIHTADVNSFEEAITNVENFVNFEIEFSG